MELLHRILLYPFPLSTSTTTTTTEKTHNKSRKLLRIMKIIILASFEFVEEIEMRCLMELKHKKKRMMKTTNEIRIYSLSPVLDTFSKESSETNRRKIMKMDENGLLRFFFLFVLLLFSQAHKKIII